MTHRRHLITRIVVLLALIGLLPATGVADDHAPADADVGRAILNRMLEAHGGYDRFRSMGTFNYTIPDFPLGEKAPMDFNHTADLKHRRHYMVGANYRAAFDGNTAWAVGAEHIGLPSRFVTIGNSYFVMMPFVFGDPGVEVHSIGEREFHGDTYDALAVAYRSGTGDTAEDSYVLYVDQDTHRLRLIHFTVTYAAVRGDTPIADLPRKVLLFDNWQDADGLLIPARATFNAWNKGSVEGDGNSFTVTKAVFHRHAPNQAIFEAPEDATIDESHAAR